jgi:hypothetical protein
MGNAVLPSLKSIGFIKMPLRRMKLVHCRKAHYSNKKGEKDGVNNNNSEFKGRKGTTECRDSGLAHFIHRLPQGQSKKMKKGIGDVSGGHSAMNVPLGHPLLHCPLSNFFTLHLIFLAKIHAYFEMMNE